MNLNVLETISANIPDLWENFIQKAEALCQDKYKDFAGEKEEAKEDIVLEEIISNPELISEEYLKIAEAVDLSGFIEGIVNDNSLKDKITEVQELGKTEDIPPDELYRSLSDIEFDLIAKINLYNNHLETLYRAIHELNMLSIASGPALKTKFRTSLQKLKLHKNNTKNLFSRIQNIKAELQKKITALNEKSLKKIFEDQIDGCLKSFDQVLNDQALIVNSMDSFQPFPLENMKGFIARFKQMRDYLELYPDFKKFIDSCKTVELNPETVKKLEQKAEQFFKYYDLFSEKSRKIFLDKMSNVTNKKGTFKQRFIDPISAGFDQEYHFLANILGEGLFK
jgi:hypothetical protein